MSREEQPVLDNFLEAEAEAREAGIDPEATARHKEALAARWQAYCHRCRDSKKKDFLEKEYNLLVRERN